MLGANDGLVSNLSLVMGVAGAELSGQTILVTGLAGLLAGACSMAMGEWLSVQSARELNQRQLAIEAEEIATVPEEEQQELALIYEAKGLSKDEAQAIAAKLMADKDSALDALVREELGIDPQELGGRRGPRQERRLSCLRAVQLCRWLPFVLDRHERSHHESAGERPRPLSGRRCHYALYGSERPLHGAPAIALWSSGGRGDLRHWSPARSHARGLRGSVPDRRSPISIPGGEVRCSTECSRLAPKNLHIATM